MSLPVETQPRHSGPDADPLREDADDGRRAPASRPSNLSPAGPQARATGPGSREQGRGSLRRRLALAGIGIAVAASAAAAAYLLLARPLQVQVAVPQRAVPIEVYGLGSVEARVLSKVGFEVAGTVQQLHADQGDRVGEGAVLARLDARQQDARVAQAQAAVAQAKASLAEAEDAVAKADVVLAQAQRTSERKQQLVRGSIVSDQAAEDAKAAVDIAAAERSQAASRIRVARANLEQAEATLGRERTVLSQHTLFSPFPALVVTRHLELGAPARSADPVFTLVDPETVWVRVYVDEALSGRLQVGQAAVIKLRSLPERRFSGRIARIGVENDRIGEERRVEIACQDCPADFHLGEQAEAVMTTAELDQALLVPFAAFEEADARGGAVWTVEDERLQRRRVPFGHRTLDGRMEIPDGALPEGAAVVVERSPGLRVGRAAVPIAAGQR